MDHALTLGSCFSPVLLCRSPGMSWFDGVFNPFLCLISSASCIASTPVSFGFMACCLRLSWPLGCGFQALFLFLLQSHCMLTNYFSFLFYPFWDLGGLHALFFVFVFSTDYGMRASYYAIQIHVPWLLLHRARDSDNGTWFSAHIVIDALYQTRMLFHSFFNIHTFVCLQIVIFIFINESYCFFFFLWTKNSVIESQKWDCWGYIWTSKCKNYQYLLIDINGQIDCSFWKEETKCSIELETMGWGDSERKERNYIYLVALVKLLARIMGQTDLINKVFTNQWI